MTEQQLSKLIEKYLLGSASEEERLKVERWYESFDTYEEGFEAEENMVSFLRSWLRVKEKIANTKSESKNLNGQTKYKSLYKWAAVAAILILLSGTYFLINKNEETGIARQQIKNDFKPGGNKAILTLGNGQKIMLDSSSNGLLSMQGNTKVLKLNKGTLSYKEGSGRQKAESKQEKVTFNTISTPRGGKYEVVLPDGSKVWMNAGSSLRFPTSFVGNKRVVEMTGEAYFEIAQNEDMPFEVEVKGMIVKVLGTHFNIMAYEENKGVRTALLEGKVRVTTGEGQEVVLNPGQRAIWDMNGDLAVEKIKNRQQIIAWKNGLFWFENSDINEVMKQLSRWYDVDIEIKGNIPDLFTGSIPRELSFSEVFEVLQKTGSVHYEIEDNRKIVITP